MKSTSTSLAIGANMISLHEISVSFRVINI
jgi:hypothetical protein